jgi:hypothetical protein
MVILWDVEDPVEPARVGPALDAAAAAASVSIVVSLEGLLLATTAFDGSPEVRKLASEAGRVRSP